MNSTNTEHSLLLDFTTHTSTSMPQHDLHFVDPSIFLVWIVAVFAIVVGGYLRAPPKAVTHSSAPEEQPKSTTSLQEQPQMPPQTNPSHTSSHTQVHQLSLIPEGELVIETNKQHRSPKKSLNSKTVAVIVIVAILTLLLTYFFYKYAVYFFIALFALLSAHGAFSCTSSIFNHLFSRVADHRLSVPFMKTPPRISSTVILIISISISSCWVVFRKECHIWILQVTLAVCFCVTFIREHRVSTLKTGALLLMVMLFYDVFMVFITPYFTSNGRSVMEQVAMGASVGEGSKETMPIVIKIPKLIQSSSVFCGRAYSLLRLGDILLPGPFVSFCRSFDLLTPSRWSVYFITCCLGYGIGLMVATFAALMMGTGQPALLYTSPSMLLGVVCVGLCKGELMKLWKGKYDLHVRATYEQLAKTESFNEA